MARSHHVVDPAEVGLLRAALAAASTRIDALQSEIASLRAGEEAAVQAERARIAQIIHDGVAQNLALLLLRLDIVSRLAESDPPRMKGELAKVVLLTEASVHELRRSIYSLRAPDVSRLGLIPALRRLATGLHDQTNINVVLSHPDEAELPPSHQVALYSAAQERLNAVAAESLATAARVDLVRSGPQLILRLQDNGRHPRARSGRPSVEEGNLRRLEELARSIDGTVDIRQNEIETVVEIAIPLK